MMKLKLLLLLGLNAYSSFSQVNTGSQVSTGSQAITTFGPQYYIITPLYLLAVNGTLVSSPVAVYSYYFQDLGRRIAPYSPLDIASINKAIPQHDRYDNPKFVNGYLIYSSGNQSQTVKLNYNQFLAEMQFVDDTNDTLLVARADSISFVRLEDDLYKHDFKKGYFRVLSGTGKVTLTSKLQVAKIRQKDANRYSVLSKKTRHFLIDQNENICKANMAGFLKAFSEHTQQIGTYLKQMTRQGHPIKFSCEDDLVKLMKFCESLSEQS